MVINRENIKKESLKMVIQTLFYFLKRAEDMSLIEKIKIDENDLFVIHYLVMLIDQQSKDEDMANTLLNVLRFFTQLSTDS